MSKTHLEDFDKDIIEEALEYVYNLTGGEKTNFSRLNDALHQEKKNNTKLLLALEKANESTPIRVKQAIDSADSCLNQLEELKNQQSQTSSNISGHISTNKETVNELSEQTDYFEELQRLKSYVSWIGYIETISCTIGNYLLEGLVGSACEEYSNLLKVSETLAETSCQNLKNFLEATKTYWFEILTNRLTSEFDNVMKALKWPFTSGITAPSVTNQPELHSKMERLFFLLLKLQTPSDYHGEQKTCLLLPLDLLIRPLGKRFRFHFYGNKKTNSLDKPEWYFTQVLNWLKDHSDFLEHTVQPILDKNGFSHVSSKTEFTKGLLAVVEEKMRHSLPFVIKEDGLFSHFVDEALLFEKEFRTITEYPSSQIGCLSVLTEEKQCLDKWLEVERKCSMHHVKSVLTAPNAWSLKYQEVADIDETKVPECVESFVTILQVMTERYSGLSNFSHCLKFVAVQLELLAYFITSLKSLAQENSVRPTDHHYCSVMNAANYITIMLQEWSEQMFFLQLSHCKLSTLDQSSAEEGQDEDIVNKDREEEEKDKEVSVFSTALKSLEKLQEVMIEVLVDFLLDCFKVRSKSYKNDRWHCLPSRKDYLVVSLSSSACEMMLYLKEQLITLEQQLAKKLFIKAWKQLAGKLNSFIFTEIILANHFNDGGAFQLEYDMVKNLFLLFGEYTQKPENFFKEVKESCKLLCLLQGSAVLLLDVLNRSESTGEENDLNLPSPTAALSDIGVHKLTPQEARNVLALRLNWPNN